MGNYIGRIFGESPVMPLQEHMDVCYQAAKELIQLFEHAMAERWEQVAESRAKIVELERRADDLKSKIRSHLPKSLFMPVPREDLLDLCMVQDAVANRARNVSGLVIGRQMLVPREIQEDFLAYVTRNVNAAKVARKSIRELDELFETGFRGAEADFVTSLVQRLDEIEKETDEMQVKVRAALFGIEKSLHPVDVMFLYHVIDLVAEVGNTAQRIGRRLEILLSH